MLTFFVFFFKNAVSDSKFDLWKEFYSLPGQRTQSFFPLLDGKPKIFFWFLLCFTAKGDYIGFVKDKKKSKKTKVYVVPILITSLSVSLYEAGAS